MAIEQRTQEGLGRCVRLERELPIVPFAKCFFDLHIFKLHEPFFGRFSRFSKSHFFRARLDDPHGLRKQQIPSS